MEMLPYLMYQRPDDYEQDARNRITEAILMAQNTIPAGMQKHYIDTQLFGQPPQAPQVSQENDGQRPKGQVGMTVMTPEQEARLRAQLKKLRPNLPQSAYDEMISEHKAAKGLR